MLNFIKTFYLYVAHHVNFHSICGIFCSHLTNKHIYNEIVMSPLQSYLMSGLYKIVKRGNMSKEN